MCSRRLTPNVFLMTANWYELENLAHLEQIKAMDDLRRPRLWQPRARRRARISRSR